MQNLNYLTEIQSEKVQKFIQTENKLSLDRLEKDPRYPEIHQQLEKILTAKDKLPHLFFVGQTIYDVWQDDQHIKGILRKTDLASLNTGKPNWKTVLDLDQLAKNENKNWVWKGLHCLNSQEDLCMLQLSEGGQDASVFREYDLKTGKFVETGFYLSESKSDLVWVDKDTLLLADGRPGQKLTLSGYPSQIKIWKRGQSVDQSKIIFTGDQKDMGVWISAYTQAEKTYFHIYQGLSFYAAHIFLINTNDDFKITKLPLPTDADLATYFKGFALFNNRTEFDLNGTKLAAGHVIALDLKNLENPQFQIVFKPTKTRFFEFLTSTKNFLILGALDDVKKNISKVDYINNQWEISPLSDLKKSGNTTVVAASTALNQAYISYTDFLTPTTYRFLDLDKNTNTKVMSAPARFKSDDFVSHQYKTTSKDGTTIPYFIVHSKKIQLDGKNPTLIYAYGGFEYALTPHYLGAVGKAWLEKGGVYVLANIRGGGEYGPTWHNSVLRENRQKVFDDFYAVAEDIIRKKISSPNHLGIQGGSNGGLLTSVAFTQRPDLYKAVISEVPLANMMEYHKWLAGNSWMEEYGNPDDPEMRKYLLGYSPLHNLSADKKYPEVFYVTSTKDDRVHPAHARQMVARMRELGHPVMYFENQDGGHGRAANMKDYARLMALEFTYLFQKLSK